jgi:peptidoglycan/xylan/chitin deacetylase (PgdA/CDA1 family)
MYRSIARKYYLNLVGYFSAPKNGIHILNSHYVSPSSNIDYNADVFEGFVRFISKKCKLITIQEAVAYIIEGRYNVNHPFVALTFDDGFEDCASVICPILDKYSCRAAFFINSNYIDGDNKYISEFNQRIISPEKHPMTWEQIRKIHNKGHVIGSHTTDHVDLAKLPYIEILNQIEGNKRIIEEKLNTVCDYFAWPFGRMIHFNDTALEIARLYHRYIFSATNYTKYFSMDDGVINRRHVEPYWSNSHINYFLSNKKK